MVIRVTLVPELDFPRLVFEDRRLPSYSGGCVPSGFVQGKYAVCTAGRAIEVLTSFGRLSLHFYVLPD